MTGALLVLAAMAAAPGGASAPAPWDLPDPARVALWGALLPGGGQFALGEWAEGAGVLGGVAAGAGVGFWMETRRDPGEWNVPFLLALKLDEWSIYAAYREARIQSDPVWGAIRALPPADPEPPGRLWLAPFTEDALRPGVVAFALAGAAIAAGETAASGRPLALDARRVRRVRIDGWDLNPAVGGGAYGAEMGLVSLGAGVGEEGLWRGVLQNEYEGAWGPIGGWIAVSVLFGAAHLLNPGPTDLASLAYVGSVATAGGLGLGRIYQAYGYRLAPGVAAHFWFDFLSGLTAYALDPESNPIGVRVQMDY